MPNIFKALASITAWVLFIGGCIGMLGTSISYWVGVGAAEPPSLLYQFGWLFGAAQLTMAVVVMRLRQKME